MRQDEKARRTLQGGKCEDKSVKKRKIGTRMGLHGSDRVSAQEVLERGRGRNLPESGIQPAMIQVTETEKVN